MKRLTEIGFCPKCDFPISIFKTSNYKRFAMCDGCGISYPLPKAGSINNSAMNCPSSKYPILIVEKKEQKAYFWADKPCFTCSKSDKCQPIKDLILEFTELKVYGY